jgi:ABC-type branched-subunit amino acid transport system permease subunit
MNDIGAALIQTVLALQAFWWLAVIIGAILFFLMPFFILRIRNEVIALKTQAVQLNRNLATLTMITRAANKSEIPPPQTCPQCQGECLWPYEKCKACGADVAWS